MSIQLSRQQRRQMQKLADRVDRVSQSDRRFFERRPDRMHRVRIASQAEIEQFGILAATDDPRPPAGFQHYIVVKNIAPGIRLRLPLTSRADNDVDVSEAEASWLYETTITPRGREIEAQMRKGAEARA